VRHTGRRLLFPLSPIRQGIPHRGGFSRASSTPHPLARIIKHMKLRLSHRFVESDILRHGDCSLWMLVLQLPSSIRLAPRHPSPARAISAMFRSLECKSTQPNHREAKEAASEEEPTLNASSAWARLRISSTISKAIGRCELLTWSSIPGPSSPVASCASPICRTSCWIG
jgi:hypothetical protein